jgi:hypothetical protein
MIRRRVESRNRITACRVDQENWIGYLLIQRQIIEIRYQYPSGQRASPLTGRLAKDPKSRMALRFSEVSQGQYQ